MERRVTPAWTRILKLHELGRGPVQLRLEPAADERAAIARQLRLESLPALSADLTVSPWMDGLEITGRIRAVVEQICGVSLDAFEQAVDGEIEVRAVPASSALAQVPEGSDLQLDADGPDAPDVMTGDSVDLAAYVIEHLALEIDPFPRKPGAVFDYEGPVEETSPFAALKKLTEPKA
jgi:uncharacterized metal-binding protein YceD (DUF177 family)